MVRTLEMKENIYIGIFTNKQCIDLSACAGYILISDVFDIIP